MYGLIRRREVLWQTAYILRHYGVRIYLAALLSLPGTTFLGVLVRSGYFTVRG
jgi:hypothetical protein